MPLTDSLIGFEKARLAMGNSDLMDVYNVDIEVKDDSKLVHSIRKSPAGYVQGTFECSGSFDTLIHPGGPEADWIKSVQTRSTNQYRFKASGVTITIDAKNNSVKAKQAVDGATEFNISFVGNVTL